MKPTPDLYVFMENLRYDPKTGYFWWIKRGVNRSYNAPAGTIAVTGHRQLRFLRRSYLEHRLAWFFMTGAWPKLEIDHKNRDRGDNRWENLREATHGQNQANSKRYKNNKSGYKGVVWVKKCRKWHAAIRTNNKKICLGFHSAIGDAHAAYVEAAKKYHGEFAYVE